MPQTIQMKKAQLTQTRIVDVPPAPLQEGEARLRVESFAVTANNVTYAVIGDMFGYWNFFPAEGEWGVVPMWGHAVVDESRHPDVAVGERVYGYLPMATHLVIQPGRISAGSLTDMTDYRQPMSVFYNQYSRLTADPEHDPAREDARMIFGPLFKTGFLIAAMFARENWFGAEVLVMTSASSKTSLALAHCAREVAPGVQRIGLTSAGNVDFVARSGLYDQVIAYDDIASLPQQKSVSVDFAGNAGLLRAIHTTLGDNLAYSCLVGATHVEGRGSSGDPMPGPAPILFFAPDHAGATVKELGPEGFATAVGKSWLGFVSATDGFMAVSHRHGVDAAAEAFQSILAGSAPPDTGIVIRP